MPPRLWTGRDDLMCEIPENAVVLPPCEWCGEPMDRIPDDELPDHLCKACLKDLGYVRA